MNNGCHEFFVPEWLEKPLPLGEGLGEGLPQRISLTGFLKLGLRLANEIRLSRRERKKSCLNHN